MSNPDWQEKIKDRVRELWCEEGRQWIEIYLFEKKASLRLEKMEGSCSKKEAFFEHETEAECWVAALLFLWSKKNESK